MMRVSIFLLLLSSAGVLYSQSRDAIEQNRSGVDSAKSGEYSDAMTHFNKSIELQDKESAKAIHNIGWLYELNGDNENALIYYEEAIRRNPEQVHTLERAGFMHYLKKDFNKAILYGERVLKIDQMNQEVIKWLPDAYAQMFKLKGQIISDAAAKKEQQKIVEQVKEQKKEEKKQRRYIVVTYDTMLRFSYRLQGKTGFKYTPTDSFLLNIPGLLNADFTPTEQWEIKAQTGVPYYGALAPDLVWWTEKVEGYFYQKNYFLGLGLMGNHYGGTSMFGTGKKLSDYKLGIIVGKYQERSRLDIILYPRMFPADNGTESKVSMDVDSVDVAYSYLLSEDQKIYGRMKLNDFYYFNNTEKKSNYYGVYDFTVGFGLHDKPAASYLFRFEYTERMYLKNLNNNRPYSMFNGQGLFGLDAYHWFLGRPMSGIQTFASVFSVYAQEQIYPRFFIYQKFSVELVPLSQKQHDICLLLGVGGTY